MPPKHKHNKNREPTVRVNAEGDIIYSNNGKKFIALPSVPVSFGTPSDQLDAYEFDQPHHETTIGRGIFYISQTPEGRKLLQYIWDERIRFYSSMNPPFSGAPISYVKDWNQNTHSLTLFASPVDAVGFTFALIEEVTHAQDIKKLGLPNHDEKFSLRKGTIVERALEASGQAAIARFVFTSYLQQKQNPDRFCPPLILEKFESFAPICFAAGMRALPLLEEGRSDLFTQQVFASVYEDKEFQATYDNWQLNFYLDNFPSPVAIKQDMLQHPPYGTFMQDDNITHEMLAEAFEVDGIKYLQNIGLRLDDPEYTTLSDTPTIRQAFAALSRRINGSEGASFIALDRTTIGPAGQKNSNVSTLGF